MGKTLFEQYGGFAKLSKIVSAFYESAVDSPVIGRYFENIDMKRLIDHQTKFIASLMGGPASYTDEELERMHARLNITEEAFTEMATLLEEALEDHEIEAADIKTIMEHVVGRKRFIVISG